jgi:hypothetical protein
MPAGMRGGREGDIMRGTKIQEHLGIRRVEWMEPFTSLEEERLTGAFSILEVDGGLHRPAHAAPGWIRVPASEKDQIIEPIIKAKGLPSQTLRLTSHCPRS